MTKRTDFETIQECRICGSADLVPVLDYGETPLANALPRTAEAALNETTYPLTLAFCQECSLIQIRETVPPEVLFYDYPYFSSNSPSFVEAARTLATRLMSERDLDCESLVAEAASNDGYLLKHYAAQGVPVVGIEPAANVAKDAEKVGVRTRVEFFGLDSAKRIVDELGRVDVFHANNVLAHVPALHDFVAGVAHILKPTGTTSIECPYAEEFVAHCEFDTVYHEHLCYYSLTALDRLFRMNGLEIVDVERLPTHGGSVRIFAMHAGAGTVSDRVIDLLAHEKESGLTSAVRLADFASRAKSIGADLKALIEMLVKEGKSVAAYGASAKGATLLNFSGITHDLIEFVADRSAAKNGRLMPGAHLPVVQPEALLEKNPDYVVLLTWNFADEIFAQQKPYTDGGGRFIVPIPAPHIVDPA